MTKKDFELIASVLRNSSLEERDKKELARDFADIFSERFERFDTIKFMKAVMKYNEV